MCARGSSSRAAGIPDKSMFRLGTTAFLLAPAFAGEDLHANQPFGGTSKLRGGSSCAGVDDVPRNYGTAGLPLLSMPEVDLVEFYEQNGRPFELELGVVEYAGPEATFDVRGYCGAIPGPVLIFRRGEKNRMTLVNRLENRVPEEYEMNNYSRPSTTNIHTVRAHSFWCQVAPTILALYLCRLSHTAAPNCVSWPNGTAPAAWLASTACKAGR